MTSRARPYATPAVSIVMPAFNAEATIAWAIETVRSQSFGNWELLIVDDHSRDDTRAIARRYLGLDARIRVLSAQHKGVSAARNTGILKSRGGVIAFLDSDDGWHPEKLSRHLEQLAHCPGTGISYSQVEFLDAQGLRTGKHSRARTRDVQPHHLLCSNPASTASSLVVRREVFQRAGLFNTNMSFAEDLEWLIRASLLSGYALAGLDQPLTLYRTSPAGLSSRLESMQQGWEALIREVGVYAPELVRRHYLRARAEHLFYLARRALRLSGQRARALGFLQKACRSDWRILLRKPAKTFAVYALAQMARCCGSRYEPSLRRS